MFSIEFDQDTDLDELRKIRLILDTLIGDKEDEDEDEDDDEDEWPDREGKMR